MIINQWSVVDDVGFREDPLMLNSAFDVHLEPAAGPGYAAPPPPVARTPSSSWKQVELISDGDEEFVCDHCMTTRAPSSFAAASSCSDFPSSDPDAMSVEAVAESSCGEARRKHKYIICQEDDE